jgi:hypothetical protein
MKAYPSREVLDSLPGFGKDNWMKYSFNRTYSNPYPESDFDVYLDPKGPSEIIPVDEAGNRAARELHETFGNIYVAMSGGIDSEWVAKCFLRHGIPFTPIIYEAEDLQYMDTHWAVKWCEDNGITPVIYKDFIPTFSRRIAEASSRLCCRNPGGPATIKPLGDYVKSLGGHLITGAAFPEYFPDPNLMFLKYKHLEPKLFDKEGNQIVPDGWIMHESDIAHARWGCADHPYTFHTWSPEILLSYIAARDVTKTSEYNKKHIFDCIERPKLMGTPKLYWRTDPIVGKIGRLIQRIGRSEIEYLGTTEELIQFLTTGVKPA